MAGILTLLAEFMAKAIIIGGFLGLMTRTGNILIRAVSGKEDVL